MRKIDRYKNRRFGSLSEQNLEPIYKEFRKAFRYNQTQFDKKGIESFPLRRARQQLENLSPNLSEHERKVAETKIYRDFFFQKTRPDAPIRKKSKTATVKGYETYLEKTGSRIGIGNYADWSETDRQTLWELIDKIREIPGAQQYFATARENSNYLYQSATSFNYIASTYSNEYLDSPVEVFKKLTDFVHNAETGNYDNRITAEAFYGALERRARRV